MIALEWLILIAFILDIIGGFIRSKETNEKLDDLDNRTQELIEMRRNIQENIWNSMKRHLERSHGGSKGVKK